MTSKLETQKERIRVRLLKKDGYRGICVTGALQECRSGEEGFVFRAVARGGDFIYHLVSINGVCAVERSLALEG